MPRECVSWHLSVLLVLLSHSPLHFSLFPFSPFSSFFHFEGLDEVRGGASASIGLFPNLTLSGHFCPVRVGSQIFNSISKRILLRSMWHITAWPVIRAQRLLLLRTYVLHTTKLQRLGYNGPNQLVSTSIDCHATVEAADRFIAQPNNGVFPSSLLLAHLLPRTGDDSLPFP